MPDDFFFHVRIATAAGVAAAAIVAILFFTPILDNMGFCFPRTCAPMQTAQNDCPNKGAVCEPCGTACADGQKDEEKKKPDGGGSVTTTIDDHSVDEDHSITIENIVIHGSVGSWCPLPPDEEKEDECVAGSPGAKEPLGEVYFAHDSSDLSEESKGILDCVIKEIEGRLKKQTGETILLEAYTSHPGTAAYNQYLAGERMKNVEEYIKKEYIKRFMGATWKFRQDIYGESHIYRDTGETSDWEGDPKNRVVRIFACSDPCCDMEQEAVSNPNPQACAKAKGQAGG